MLPTGISLSVRVQALISDTSDIFLPKTALQRDDFPAPVFPKTPIFGLYFIDSDGFKFTKSLILLSISLYFVSDDESLLFLTFSG
nr:hypothetical protein [Acetobacter thailandicus]